MLKQYTLTGKLNRNETKIKKKKIHAHIKGRLSINIGLIKSQPTEFFLLIEN